MKPAASLPGDGLFLAVVVPIAAIYWHLTLTRAREDVVKRLVLSVAAIGISSTTAFSMPLFNQTGSMARPTLVENARIVCEESGFCYRVPGRRPVARWIYGDGAFYGPYDGPRVYGWPGRQYRWSFLSPW